MAKNQGFRHRNWGRHTHSGPQRMSVGIVRGYRKQFDEPLEPNNSGWMWHTTQRPPWDLKRERRRANKLARKSRKANRPC